MQMSEESETVLHNRW